MMSPHAGWDNAGSHATEDLSEKGRAHHKAALKPQFPEYVCSSKNLNNIGMVTRQMQITEC